MLSTLLTACGKSVQSLRIHYGKICQQTSTLVNIADPSSLLTCVHTLFIRTIVPTYPLVISTPKFANSSLLNTTFTHFPHPLLLTPPKKI